MALIEAELRTVRIMVLFRDEEASAHMQKKAHLSIINIYHRHPTSCSVRHVEESHAAGRQRIFLGPVPLTEFQVHRHLQPKSRFTDRHDIGNRVLGGCRNVSSRLRKQARTLDHG